MLSRFMPGVVLFLILVPAGVVKPESYSIENLLNKVPFSELVQNDDINASILNALLRKKKSNAAGGANWVLEKHSDNTIVVLSENERWVLRVVPHGRRE